MTEKFDRIFLVEKDSLTHLTARSFREGMFGKSLEEALQELIEKYPDIIPGGQIDPGSDDPPRFVLLCREMLVGGGSLDLLLVDQYGVLTLVETKLAENREARREVIGQIIEYAANAVELWRKGEIREKAAEFWKEKYNKDIEDVIRESFGVDLDSFWQDVEKNLEEGRIRLIIASDEIRPEVRRMIEYLNREMENAEVYGLELRRFGQEPGPQVLVPYLVGETQEIADRKLRKSVGKWDEDSFFEDVKRKTPEQVVKAIYELYDFSKKIVEGRGRVTLGKGGKVGTFRVSVEGFKRNIYLVDSEGRLEIWFSVLYSSVTPDKIELVNKFAEQLYNMGFLSEKITDKNYMEEKKQHPNINSEKWVSKVEDFKKAIKELIDNVGKTE